MLKQSKDSKEIREITNDILQHMKTIKESYVFGRESQGVIPEEGGLDSELTDLSSEKQDMGKPQTKNIDSEVKEMRRIALSVIGNLTPMEDPEAYKLVKSVWDSCDKFLTKDVKDPKQTQNQNNIN
jgi:hypothetical protein